MKQGQKVNVFRRDRSESGRRTEWYWIASGIVTAVGTRFARVLGRSDDHLVNEEFAIQSDCCKIVPITPAQ